MTSSKPLSQAYAEAMEAPRLHPLDTNLMYDDELNIQKGRELQASDNRRLTLAACKVLEAAEMPVESVRQLSSQQIHMQEALVALRAELDRRGK